LAQKRGALLCQTWSHEVFALYFVTLKRIAPDTWQQIKTAYASGLGLREIARNMGIPEGTVLARAKRDG
jgi:DNA-directed RNA polymerase specialized sigma24 family protein